MSKYGRHHIGTKFNDGNLIVVNGGDKNGFVRVKCNVCAKDSELFGDGVFETLFGNLLKCKVPCGCSKSPRWTLAQYEVRIKRKILDEKLLIKFLGFGENANPPKNTSIRLYCEKHNVSYEARSINDFFAGHYNLGKTYKLGERISEYNKNNLNHTVWDSGKKSKCGKAIVKFYCKICKSKDYDSLFHINSSDLFKGRIPCYCSKKRNISVEHIINASKRKLNLEGINKICVTGAHKTRGVWHTDFFCEIHGAYTRESRAALNKTGCYCLECTPPFYGYDKTQVGYLYILEIQINTVVILGYGITNNLEQRLTTHKFKLSQIGATITNIQVFEGSGTAVLAVENAIKSLHTTGLLDCEGFRRESISIDMKDKVLEKCKKLKQLDNSDKLI